MKVREVLLFFMILFLTSCLSSRAFAGNDGMKKIFILHSYHPTFKWSSNIERGYAPYLFHESYHIHTEYMDVLRNPFTGDREEALIEELNSLYRDILFDLLLIVDDPALHFVNRHLSRLPFLNHVPAIAATIDENGYRDISIPEAKIIENKIHVTEIVAQASAFFPEVENVFILCDYSLPGLLLREEIFRQLHSDSRAGRLSLLSNANASFPDLLKELRSLPKNTVILFAGYHTDSTGSYFPASEVLHAIRTVSNLPLFSLFDTWIMGDVIGGLVTRSTKWGELLGQEAVKKTGGTLVCYDTGGSFPLPTKWIFNEPALAKYGLPPSSLPKDAITLNKASIAASNTKLFVLLTCFIGFFSLIITIAFIIHLFSRKKMKKRIVELESEIEQFDLFISEMPMGYLELNEEARIVRCNRSAEKILGYPEREIIGKNPDDFLFMNGEIARERTCNPNMPGNVFHSLVAHTKTGEKIFGEWYMKNCQIVGKPSRLLVFFIDITEKESLRDYLENMLNKTKELMMQNDRIATAIIHDIKNLIFPIVAYSEMLIMDNISFEKMKTFSKNLNKSASDLLQVATEILDIGRTREKLTSYNPVIFVLNEIVHQVLLSSEGSIIRKEITVKNELPAEQQIYADPQMIHSVFFNLVNNAIKFTPSGGKIELSGRLISPELFEVSIKDNGAGVNEKKMRDLFVEKEHFSVRGTSGEEGTGLGLLLCKELLEINNGQLYVSNNDDGPGATFSFVLPVNQLQDTSTHENINR